MEMYTSLAGQNTGNDFVRKNPRGDQWRGWLMGVERRVYVNPLRVQGDWGGSDRVGYRSKRNVIRLTDRISDYRRAGSGICSARTILFQSYLTRSFTRPGWILSGSFASFTNADCVIRLSTTMISWTRALSHLHLRTARRTIVRPMMDRARASTRI